MGILKKKEANTRNLEGTCDSFKDIVIDVNKIFKEQHCFVFVFIIFVHLKYKSFLYGLD